MKLNLLFFDLFVIIKLPFWINIFTVKLYGENVKKLLRGSMILRVWMYGSGLVVVL